MDLIAETTEYLKYVITERWHGRDPKSPLEHSLEKFGKNEETKFPAKDDWRIPPTETPFA